MKLKRLMTFSGVPVNLARRRLVLGADAHRAGVGMALAHHDAAHGDQAGGADAELLGAQHGGDDDVAAGAHAAVGAQAHRVAQVVQRQHLVGFRQAHLPRAAGVLDRGLGRGARCRRRGRRSGSRRPWPWPRRRRWRRCRSSTTSFTRDPGVRVDLLQVVDELGQVLDRIDVVVRRRARSASRRASRGAGGRSAR